MRAIQGVLLSARPGYIALGLLALLLSTIGCGGGGVKLIEKDLTQFDLAGLEVVADTNGQEICGDSCGEPEIPGQCLGASCGDGICQLICGESSSWCPTDCCEKMCGDGTCDPFCSEGVEGPEFCAEDCCLCGDGICMPALCGEDWIEGLKTCATDCAVCGDEVCDPGEGPALCAYDCCGTCGDGQCKGGECGEEPDTCPPDCETHWCDNGNCEPGENPVDCPEDCEPYACGNSTCEPGESPADCPEDCGEKCGNCECSGGETYDSCPEDCGFCGDGYCINTCDYLPETATTCIADCCIPDCTDKPCGDDGCGGSCGQCPVGEKCNAQNKCIGCTPDCTAKECGSDGCGGDCGECNNQSVCAADGICQCLPDCDDGKICGEDGCGGSCGECVGLNQTCQDGYCLCEPDCIDKDCGEDGCSGTCGDCPIQHECKDGLCHCEPKCAVEQECGNDGCGGLCGECPEHHLCSSDKVCLCIPDCTDKACGDNGCGGSCGACKSGWSCVEGVCSDCQPDCAGKNCGSNGCSGSCGTCEATEICTIEGQCQCLPDCTGKQCGPDGCGGNCGLCLGDHCEGNIFIPESTCEEGICAGDSATNCDDTNICTDDSCDEVLGCQHVDNDAACDDTNICTVDDFCSEGACLPGPGALDCNDGFECTIDSCNPFAGCDYVPSDVLCDDFESCTTDSCNEKSGCSYTPVSNGSSCGPGDSVCTDGLCSCTPDCANKTCGDDGCGKPCGSCNPGDHCATGGQCLAPLLECDDSNSVDWDGCTAGNITEFQVNATAGGSQTHPDVAVNSSWIIFVWEGNGDKDTDGIYMRSFNLSGKGGANDVLVNTQTADFQSHPTIAMGASGRFVVAWISQNQDGSGQGVYAQRFDSNGTPVEAEFLVNMGIETGDQGQVAAAMGMTNAQNLNLRHPLFAWSGYIPVDQDNGIMLSEYAWTDAAFVDMGADKLVNEGATTGSQTAPAIAAMDDGKFMVTWQSDPANGDAGPIMGRVYDTDGTSLTGPLQLNTESQFDANNPAIAAIDSSGFVAVWESGAPALAGLDTSETGIVYVEVNDMGMPGIYEDEVVNLTTDGIQEKPDIAYHTDSNHMMVVWQSLAQDNNGSGIYARQFSEGTVLPDELSINNMLVGGQEEPAVAFIDDTLLVVTWQAAPEGLDETNIYGAILNWDGEKIDVTK